MAVKDLLWACVACGTFSAIHAARRGWEACDVCGTRYRRGPGSSITVQRPGHPGEGWTAARCLAALPALDQLPAGPLTDEVLLRRVVSMALVRTNTRALGWSERFGRADRGSLLLDDAGLSFRPAAGEPTLSFPIEAVTAIQASSRTLQINVHSHPIVSLRFLGTSPRLWEAALQERIRDLYRATGRGAIREFQPRIQTR